MIVLAQIPVWLTVKQRLHFNLAIQGLTCLSDSLCGATSFGGKLCFRSIQLSLQLITSFCQLGIELFQVYTVRFIVSMLAP